MGLLKSRSNGVAHPADVRAGDRANHIGAGLQHFEIAIQEAQLPSPFAFHAFMAPL